MPDDDLITECNTCGEAVSLTVAYNCEVCGCDYCEDCFGGNRCLDCESMYGVEDDE